MTKKKYWDNLKNDWPLVLPHSFSLGLSVFIIVTFWIYSVRYLQTIGSDYGRLLGLLVMVMVLVRICTWLGGYRLFEDWANKMVEVIGGHNE